MQKTIIRRNAEVSKGLPGCCDLMTRIYSSRGIQDVGELNLGLQQMLPYHELTDIETACKRLHSALVDNEKIVIVGDYDVDGATSTALTIRAMRSYGCQQIDYIVPNRFDFGYGLSPEIVDEAKKLAPQLLITVDNGISSHDGVIKANSYGIDVIITDHHLPSEELPAACAIVNPNRTDDKFASKNLAGVGVAFYLMVALRSYLRENKWFTNGRREPSLANLLDLVALGTVADIVKLDKNNRVLVHQGINRIRQGHPCAGITALLEVAGKSASTLVASDLGFALGPRLNAAGRLDDISIGVECLLTDDLAIALPLAEQLNQLNLERRQLEKSMKQEADIIVDSIAVDCKNISSLCLYQQNWHQGVVGLVASRVKDQVNRPTVVFAKANDDSSELKGSGRSIKSVHLRDILAEIAAQNDGLIKKFGGHAMAAGLSIEKDDFEKFTKEFERVCSSKLAGVVIEDQIETDGELDQNHFDIAMARKLADGGPWGQGFPEPVFDGRFRIMDQTLVGGYHLKLVLQPLGSNQAIEAISFFVDLKKWPNKQVNEIIAVYHLDINTYCGRSKLQLIVDYLVEK